jgi:hypothetical protein
MRGQLSFNCGCIASDHYAAPVCLYDALSAVKRG